MKLSKTPLRKCDTRYRTIYADPPLMKTRDICALPVRDLADENAHLYLWATNNHLQDAFKVIKAWGFTYKTMITWLKDKKGLGQYFRGKTEHCLFAVRGVLPYKVQGGKRCQGVTGFFAPRTEHSRKPEEMRDMIELVSYPPRIELFARRIVDGWDCWGDEVRA